MFRLDGLAMLSLAPHKGQVNLQALHGVQLPAAGLGERPRGQERTRCGTRSLRFKTSQPVDAVQVEMIVAAARAMAERLLAERALPRDDGDDRED